MAARGATLREVRADLERLGLLLQSDPRLPSVAGLVAGEGIRGSWWGHARGRAIFRTCEALEEDPDVTVAKLVAGKVTYVHRRLFTALATVGAAREPWQMRGLTRPARALLSAADRAGELRTHKPPRSCPTGARLLAAARELETCILVHGEEFHTETGAHARRLESWQRWSRRARVRGRAPSPDGARAALEAARDALSGGARAAVRLPWERAATRPR